MSTEPTTSADGAPDARESGPIGDGTLLATLRDPLFEEHCAVIHARLGARSAQLYVDRGRIVGPGAPHGIVRALADVLAWREGRFALELGVRSGECCGGVPIEIAIRRATALIERVTELTGSLGAPSDRYRARSDARPSDPADAGVLARCDGERSVLSVVTTHVGDEGRAALMLTMLVRRGLVERVRDVGAAPSGPTQIRTSTWDRMVRWVTGQIVAEEAPEPDAVDDAVRPATARDAPLRRGSKPSPWQRHRPLLARELEPSLACFSEMLALEAEACATDADRAFVERVREAIVLPDEIPEFPPLSRALAEMLRARTPSTERSAELVATDEALAKRVMSAASASVFGRRAETLPQAIARIGLERVFRLSTQDLLSVGDASAPLLKPLTMVARRTSLLVADLAASLAEPTLRADAYLAGLLHEVGTLEIHRIAGMGEAPSMKCARQIADGYQVTLGVLRARRWELGDAVEQGIARFATAERSSDVPPVAIWVRAGQIAAHGALHGVEARAVVDALRALPGSIDTDALRTRAEDTLGKTLPGATTQLGVPTRAGGTRAGLTPSGKTVGTTQAALTQAGPTQAGLTQAGKTQAGLTQTSRTLGTSPTRAGVRGGS